MRPRLRERVYAYWKETEDAERVQTGSKWGRPRVPLGRSGRGRGSVLLAADPNIVRSEREGSRGAVGLSYPLRRLYRRAGHTGPVLRMEYTMNQ